jgi:hypothetical protein
MSRRHRSAWQRRLPQGRVARIAVPLAIPVALAAIVGVIVAVSGGGVTQVNQSALANCVAPSASASASAPGSASPAAAPAPCPSATTTTATATPSATATAPAVNPEAGRPDLAEANPMDPAGNAISLTQTPAEAANTLNCTLTAPRHPLTAQGLATPWQLGDGCSMANPAEEAFVESTILAPNGKLTVYDPLVITQGTTAAATSAPPTIPRGSQVIINVGFNGNNIVLEGRGAHQGNCIDAFGNSIIAQTSACNAQAFFRDANAQIGRGTLHIPAVGTATDGQACQTTQSFALIDQDQSDNVITTYLLNGTGQTAQDTAANKAAMGGSTVVSNGSDDALLGHFVDPTLGCTPLTATDTTSPNGTDGSQSLNELSARQNQGTTPALLPVNDPQLLVAGQFSIGKTNTYRALTDQAPLSANTNKTQNAATYCQNMVNLQPTRLQLDMAKEAVVTSPVPAVGNTLATFLGARLSASFTNLNCQNFGLTNPTTVTVDGNGVATAVTFTVTQQTAKLPAGAATGTAGAGGKGGAGANKAVPTGRHGHHQNGAGM